MATTVCRASDDDDDNTGGGGCSVSMDDPLVVDRLDRVYFCIFLPAAIHAQSGLSVSDADYHQTEAHPHRLRALLCVKQLPTFGFTLPISSLSFYLSRSLTQFRFFLFHFVVRTTNKKKKKKIIIKNQTNKKLTVKDQLLKKQATLAVKVNHFDFYLFLFSSSIH